MGKQVDATLGNVAMMVEHLQNKSDSKEKKKVFTQVLQAAKGTGW